MLFCYIFISCVLRFFYFYIATVSSMKHFELLSRVWSVMQLKVSLCPSTSLSTIKCFLTMWPVTCKKCFHLPGKLQASLQPGANTYKELILVCFLCRWCEFLHHIRLISALSLSSFFSKPLNADSFHFQSLTLVIFDLV